MSICQFLAWQYLEGSHLKSRLTYPNGVTVDYTYEPNRDLLAGVRNHRGETVYSEHLYANDALGRRTAKNDEQYGYNARSELVSATTNGTNDYAYAYDDIGNRLSSVEPGDVLEYTANNLNQYILVGIPRAGGESRSDALAGVRGVPSAPPEDDFAPQYDEDGNQTLVRTATGIWSVSYNAENRPVRWKRGNTVVRMDFDSMGRRTYCRETEGGRQVTFTRFFYDGYLMIQQLFSNAPYNIYKEFIWDPTEPVATKLLCFRQNGQAATFLTHDGNKNVTDVIRVAPHNDSVGHYEYASFGAVISQTGNRAASNPFRFSSEFADDTLGLVYYNYRHYEPVMGRWLTRDPVVNEEGCDYAFIANDSVDDWDDLGLISFKDLLFDAGGYDKSWTIPPGSKGIPIGLGGGRLMILVTSSGSRYNCCNERGEKEVWAYANLGIEAYVMWDYGGRTEGWKGKGRDRNKRDPETGLKNKYGSSGMTVGRFVPHKFI